MRPIRHLCVPLLALWLGGCATAETPVTQYVLPADAGSQDARIPSSSDTPLVVAPPRLANYLEAEGVVLQVDDISLNQAKSHQWAAPLVQQLERGLRDRLADRLTGRRVLLSSGPAEGAMTLELSIDRFQGHYDGYAVTSGQWLLRDARRQVIDSDSFEAREPLDSDGYAALVRALGRTWDGVADTIAARVRQAS
ncbi:ABC-type transport auxiliary lipoprotein family protein [Halomonas denitrificans]|uniref:PqiC family protein n=1 Tax=Halomonas TaxID=2745 RepID=UPI001A8D45FC|nr:MULTISPECIES: ABC-type transport auxiliary lipoprotein family protein [Halomonas]MED5294554.1 ABC-type transport auxiliary lipoprotein family protein [Pseudomonadota bacterium]MBN8411080.1 membrane integrity-associated transporter subunit PqiC [Halomonas litopenaei]MBY5927286.1 membrane integrity-associated transporter subunit PqiC [Halomonas sp. DP4Y7-2]MBY5929333.1 membrane integrity-associated transporter subunit PqiC [Halomonas sp. DP8Y7-3]MBY5986185.1 membrane integrity-associated tran